MILTLDTTTKNFSMAIGNNQGKLIKEIIVPNSEFNHSEIIIKNFDLLLKKTKTPINKIKKIVCTSGPGSWTGIRVGLSFARTLSQILKIPIVSVSGLDIISYKKSLETKNNCLICPTIPVNQDEFHTAIYQYINKKIKRISNYISLNRKEISNFLKSYNKMKLKILYIDKTFSAKDLLYFSNRKGKHFSKAKPLYIRPPKINM